MEFKSELLILFGMCIGILLTIIAFKGFHYDQLKREKNPNYKKNHSAGIMGGALIAVIPIPIKDHTKDPRIKRTVKHYNMLARIFWIAVVLFILVHII